MRINKKRIRVYTKEDFEDTKHFFDVMGLNGIYYDKNRNELIQLGVLKRESGFVYLNGKEGKIFEEQEIKNCGSHGPFAKTIWNLENFRMILSNMLSGENHFIIEPIENAHFALGQRALAMDFGSIYIDNYKESLYIGSSYHKIDFKAKKMSGDFSCTKRVVPSTYDHLVGLEEICSRVGFKLQEYNGKEGKEYGIRRNIDLKEAKEVVSSVNRVFEMYKEFCEKYRKPIRQFVDNLEKQAI